MVQHDSKKAKTNHIQIKDYQNEVNEHLELNKMIFKNHNTYKNMTCFDRTYHSYQV